jgi:hypothetical protein
MHSIFDSVLVLRQMPEAIAGLRDQQGRIIYFFRGPYPETL